MPNLMPGEWDWMARLGMRGPFGLPQNTPSVPTSTPPLGATPNQGGIFGRINQALQPVGGSLPLGLALLANSGPSAQPKNFGQIFGQSALQARGMQQDSAENDLKRRYMEAQMEALRQPKQRKPIAVMGPDGKPTYVDEQDAIGQAPYNATQQQDGIGNFNPGDYTPDSFAKFIKSRDANDLVRYETPREQNPYFRDVTRTNPDGSTTQGVFNARTGTYTWPNAVVPPGKKKEVDAAATVRGEATGKAQFDMPRVEQNTDSAIDTLKKLRDHPGLGYITGIASKVPVIPGTPQAAADALAKQVEGKTFLQAFDTLRGSGAITETEGTKGTAAIGRLQRAQSKKDYQAALDELMTVFDAGRKRMREQAGVSAPAKQAKRVKVDAQGNVVGN